METDKKLPQTGGREWARFGVLAFIGLPIAILLCICAYGFLVWFGQMLWWGPPK